MLIALLALLGVDLAAVLALAAVVLGRKRWVRRRPGAFRGAVRVVTGEVDGLGHRWRRGYGRWVRDVLVWANGPFLFRNEILATDGPAVARTTAGAEIRGLGDQPVVIRLTVDGATVEVAAGASDAELLLNTNFIRRG